MTTYFDPRKDSEKHLPESERRGIYPYTPEEEEDFDALNRRGGQRAIEEILELLTLAILGAVAVSALALLIIAVRS